MQLFNKNGTIYIKFRSRSKIVSKSLKLPYNDTNLKYAKTTLLPIFMAIYFSNLQTNLDQNSTKFSANFNQTSSNLNKKQIKLSEIYAILLREISLYTKETTKQTAFYGSKRIFDFLCDKEISLYSRIEICEAIAKMKQILSPSTIRLLLSYLNSAFNKAISLNLISKNPLKGVKKPPICNKFMPNLSFKNIKNLLINSANLSHELQIFLYIAFYTGARSGEILALQNSDIDLQNAVIHLSKNQTRFELTTPKSGKSRRIFIPKKLLNFLKTLNLNNNCDKIFKSDYFRMYYYFKKLLKNENLPHFGLHQTRHIFTTILMQNGISPTFIANALGHTSLKMVNQTYSHYILTKEQSKKVEIALNF